jgi:hypothetical protein
MNTLNTLGSNPRIMLIIGIVVGLIIGMIVFWGVLPPKAVDVPPALLQSGYRDFYLAYVASEYSTTHDLDTVKTKLGADKDGYPSKQIAADLRKLAQSPSANKAQLEALAYDISGPAAAPTPAAAGPNMLLVGAACLALLVLIVAAVLLLLPRLQGGGLIKPGSSAAVRSAQSSKTVEATTWAGEAEKPLAQFVTGYEIGDDRYDTSFSIETPTGDFLGECGVGIGETIGVGNPDKVTAFEVWLFDKNDIRTVTKVLMSEYAYGDQALRAKLAPKGEPELARPDAAVELETASLKIRARVVDMEYGMGELQPRSFFNKLQLELAAWSKEVAAPPAAAERASPK